MSAVARRRPLRAAIQNFVNDPSAQLLLYLAVVVALTHVHDPRFLIALLGAAVLALLLLERNARDLLKRAFLAVALVNATVSTGYLVAALWHGEPWLEVVIRLSARVFLLTLLTLWVARRIDWRTAARRWPALRFLLVISEAQIRAFQRLLTEYRLAWRSRTTGRPSLAVRYRGSAHQVGVLMDRALAQGEEVTRAMRSRGAMDDRP